MKALLSGVLVLISLLPAAAEVPHVVTDIAPVQGLVARIMDGVAPPPPVLVPAAADPHHHALRPSEARALARADALIWVGAALTHEFGRKNPGDLVLSAVDGIETLATRKGVDLTPSSRGSDPHFWLAPPNAKIWLGAIADHLSALDPENADTYQANAVAGKQEIDSAAAMVSGQLALLKDRPYLLDHDAFQYFERHFGLRAVAAMRDSEGASPGPRRVKALRDVATTSGAACLIGAADSNPRQVALISADLSLHRLDPLGAEVPAGRDHYPGLLLALGTGFARCLMEKKGSGWYVRPLA